MVQSVYIHTHTHTHTRGGGGKFCPAVAHVCFVPVPKNMYVHSETMYVKRIPYLVTVSIMIWFWREEGHCWCITWWWVYAWTKAHNLFTFSHQFHIHYFCQWLQSLTKNSRRTCGFLHILVPTTTIVTSLLPPATTHTHKKQFTFFSCPLRQRALFCLGMKHEHPTHTICSQLDHPTYQCQAV